MDMALSRRSLLSLVAAIPLASGWPELAAPEDEGPIWDFEINMSSFYGDEVFVSALARGSIDHDAALEAAYEDNWGSWMFRWPQEDRVLDMGFRAYCEWMIADEYQEGRVGTVTVRRRGQTMEVN